MLQHNMDQINSVKDILYDRYVKYINILYSHFLLMMIKITVLVCNSFEFSIKMSLPYFGI